MKTSEILWQKEVLNIKELEPRLRITWEPGIARLLYRVRTIDQPGPDFLSTARTLGFWLTSEVIRGEGIQVRTILENGPFGEVEKPQVSSSVLLVGIPRGALPLLEGARMMIPEASFYLTNAGVKKDPQKPLLADDFPRGEYEFGIFYDGVIGSGETISRTIRAVQEKSLVKKLVLISIITSSFGAKRLLAEYPSLHLWTPCVEERYTIINNTFWVHGVGDFGQLAEPV